MGPPLCMRNKSTCTVRNSSLTSHFWITDMIVLQLDQYRPFIHMLSSLYNLFDLFSQKDFKHVLCNKLYKEGIYSKLLIQLPAYRVFLLNIERREKSESTFLINSPRFRKELCFWEGSQALPVYVSGKSNMSMHMIMQHWWKDTDTRNPKYLDQNLTQCYFVHNKSQIH